MLSLPLITMTFHGHNIVCVYTYTGVIRVNTNGGCSVEQAVMDGLTLKGKRERGRGEGRQLKVKHYIVH